MDYAKIISAAARDMRPSGIRKFFDIAAEMKDCISLGVGEPDFKKSMRWMLLHRLRLSIGSISLHFRKNVGGS